MIVAGKITSASIVLLVALACVARAAPGFNPEPFEARFSLAVRGFTVGETVWRVQRVGDGLVYETRTKATGIAAIFGDKEVVERSEWKRIGDDIKPALYRYQRSGRPDKTTAVVFDWSDGMVESTRRGVTSRMSVPADTLDKLGYMLVLMEDLKAGRRSVRYHIADGKNRMKLYELKVIGKEQMETELGKFEVLKIIRDRKTDDRQTIIWVAPVLDFMPVRIEHREREDEDVTITIHSLSKGSLVMGRGAGGGKTRVRQIPGPEDRK